MRLFSSKERKINVDALEKLCTDTSVFFLTNWNEYKFSESVHQVLAHSWQLVISNDGYGMGSFSEECLEVNNKYIRRFIERLARRMTEYTTLTDASKRLWLKSDPVTRSFDKIHVCSECGLLNHTKRSCATRNMDGSKDSIEEYFLD